MLSAFIFALQITLPNMLLMILGFVMQKNGAVNQNFVEIASDMVFQYCLPCLLFFSLIKSEMHVFEQLNLVGAGITVTVILFLLAELYAYFFVPQPQDKGVFVQGVFRSNMAIMGLATVANAYGEQGVSVGAVYMGIITILYNVLAVITLSRSQSEQGNFVQKTMRVIKKIFANPLIIALVAGFVYQLLKLPMPPHAIVKTGELLAAVALPMALICAGATVDIKSMVTMSGLSMQASIGRIVIAPIIAIMIGLLFSLSPLQMGVMFLMVASPVAAASYVMARSMGGNEVLAANILGFTTMVSMLSMAAGAAILRSFGMM